MMELLEPSGKSTISLSVKLLLTIRHVYTKIYFERLNILLHKLSSLVDHSILIVSH